MINIPYSGSGIFTSSLTMNKFAAKSFLKGAININIPQHILLNTCENLDMAYIEKTLGYPCIIKPNSSGSSLGVSKVLNQEGLLQAVEKIRSPDETVLAEEYIVGTEVTVGIIKTKKSEFVLPIAEIIRPIHDPQNLNMKNTIGYDHHQLVQKIIPARLLLHR